MGRWAGGILVGSEWEYIHHLPRSCTIKVVTTEPHWDTKTPSQASRTHRHRQEKSQLSQLDQSGFGNQVRIQYFVVGVIGTHYSAAAGPFHRPLTKMTEFLYLS